MEYLNLKLNHTYLLKYSSSDIVSSVTILLVTKKAYFLRWNHGLNTNDVWNLKKEIYKYYSIIEDITNLIETSNLFEKQNNTFNADLVDCHVCNGSGYIPDIQIPSIKIMCPLCLGGKISTPKKELI